MADVHTPNKRCHNCRRQRLRCDRSYPHCNKCLLAGKECLGYGQLFRWTGAIASRGKLAGKTSSADVSAVPAPKKQQQQQALTHSRTRPQYHLQSDSTSSSGSSPETLDWSSTDDNSSNEEWQLVTQDRLTFVDETSSPWVLADPLVQDMSYPYRHYLSYFTNRVCKDLVSYDVADRNPFRSLIPLTQANPLLQHIIVAASAAHMSNLIRPTMPPMVEPDVQLVHPMSSAESKRALLDSLTAKNKALGLMRNAMQNIDVVGVDVVLAASLFFINVELIESGKHGWKTHLEGAGKIMQLMGPSGGVASDLRDYMMSDFFSYFVLASAFTSPTSTVQSYFEASQIPLILERAAANSYLCCPPEILHIIYTAAQLSNVMVDDEESAAQVAASGMDLLRRVESVDIRSWAGDALSIPYLTHIPLASRINAGLSHQLSACLYIVQAVEPVRSLVGPEAVDSYDKRLFEHLCTIPEDDPNFKSISWPTFISGAGADSIERRIWTMGRLQQLLTTCPWGFLYTAMETLQTIWRLQSPGAERSWVQTLKDPSLNFLMV